MKNAFVALALFFLVATASAKPNDVDVVEQILGMHYGAFCGFDAKMVTIRGQQIGVRSQPACDAAFKKHAAACVKQEKKALARKSGAEAEAALTQAIGMCLLPKLGNKDDAGQHLFEQLVNDQLDRKQAKSSGKSAMLGFFCGYDQRTIPIAGRKVGAKKFPDCAGRVQRATDTCIASLSKEDQKFFTSRMSGEQDGRKFGTCVFEAMKKSSPQQK